MIAVATALRCFSRGATLLSAARSGYNAFNQVTKIVDPINGETTFTYDGNGNLLTLTDARSKTTTWTYDDMDRVETRTDPLTRDESFAYDLLGNLTSWTDRKGQVTTYQYDETALSRAKRERSESRSASEWGWAPRALKENRQTFIGFGTTGAPPSYASTITTTFDAGDRPTDIVDSVAATIERTYDLLDRLTEEVTPEGTLTYTYDDAGRRASMTATGQTAVSYTFLRARGAPPPRARSARPRLTQAAGARRRRSADRHHAQHGVGGAGLRQRRSADVADATERDCRRVRL